MFSLLTNSKKHASIWQYFTNSMILFRMTTETFSGRQHSAALCTIYTHTLICTPSYKNRPMYVQLVYRLTSHNVLSLPPCTHKETSCTSRAFTTITGRSRRTRINSNESKQKQQTFNQRTHLNGTKQRSCDINGCSQTENVRPSHIAECSRKSICEGERGAKDSKTSQSALQAAVLNGQHFHDNGLLVDRYNSRITCSYIHRVHEQT